MMFQKIINALVCGDTDELNTTIEEALKKDITATEILERGLSKGLEVVGNKFESGELFLPNMLLSAKAMNDAVAMLKVHFKEFSGIKKGKKFLIGTVKGDLHDIGKNIVSTFLGVSGFQVYDIGIDVPTHVFIEKAEELQVDIIGISALMTTTTCYMQDIINDLKFLGLREKYKVMVGGGSVTAEYADSIGADGYGENFSEAVKVARRLTDA